MKDIQAVLGHENASTSLRYTTAQKRAHREVMNRAAAAMGFGSHLEAAEG